LCRGELMRGRPIDDVAPPMARGSAAPRWRRWLWAVGGIALLLFLLVVLSFSIENDQSLAHREQAARDEMIELWSALNRFEQDVGRYPTTAEGLAALLNPPSGVVGWRGPYGKRAAVDPWGRRYVYRLRAGGKGRGGYDLLSTGADGREGTADDVLWTSVGSTR